MVKSWGQLTGTARETCPALVNSLRLRADRLRSAHRLAVPRPYPRPFHMRKVPATNFAPRKYKCIPGNSGLAAATSHASTSPLLSKTHGIQRRTSRLLDRSHQRLLQERLGHVGLRDSTGLQVESWMYRHGRRLMDEQASFSQHQSSPSLYLVVLRVSGEVSH